MIEVDIVWALLKHVELLEFIPALPVEMPNTSINTPDDGKYLAVTHFPFAPSNIAWTTPQMYGGILQINVLWTSGDGLIKPTEIAGTIVEHFEKGTVLRYGSAVVKIEQEPEIMSAIIEAHKITLPVSIRYKCSG